MFTHYLKIAFRNLFKYKTQTVVSILGLAVGFTAFTFTMSWIRYEMGYDSHNPDRDRIYMVAKVNKKEEGGLSKRVPDALAEYLKNSFPEVEAATMVRTYDNMRINDSLISLHFIETDIAFFDVFYPDIAVRFPEPLPENGITFVTSSGYRILKQSGLSDSLLMDYKTVPQKNHHSNVAYDEINIRPYKLPDERYSPWVYHSKSAFIRVYPGINIDLLQQKLDSIEVDNSMQGVMSYKLIPLKEVHYTIPDADTNIKFNHLQIFVAVALMVILCALFNYMMLFINRIKIRNRELALRKVTGSGTMQLLALLLCEFMMILLLSLFIGGVLTELLFPAFTKLSQIEASRSYFAGEMALYAIGLIILSGIFAFVPVHYFMKRSISENIHPETRQRFGFKNSFTLISIALQLIIGILLIFSTSVFFYQIRLLNRGEIGFNRQNVNQMDMWSLHDPVQLEEVKSVPGVEDAIYFPQAFLPSRGSASTQIMLDKGTPSERMQDFELFNVHAPYFFEFFDIQLLQGRVMDENETGVCIINETAKKLIGKDNPLGEKLNDYWTIVGIIPDLHVQSPLLPIQPTIYRTLKDGGGANIIGSTIAYKYAKDFREKTEQAIEEIARKKDNMPYNRGNFTNMEEVYSEYTKSERWLFILLGIMTAIAILIAVFGIYSMITLACNQRRKEIAIRKVNGAKIKEILALFFRQYLAVTVAACVVAFPGGVYVMQRWLEQYTRRVSMEWWLFAGVFVLVTAIVFTSIVFRVWKAANENPAEVIKSE
ncbi:MAG: Macrolide export ATP-binding/permease protein MacB [Bacteroidetes bacterium ADurb.BinA174]|nr:MAG: Macrolide export ATP-binding/permease protein MacB [Bacteroidetes bacterium ADurb.BinA174]